MYIQLVQQMKKTLRQLDTWLDAATAFATKKSFDPNLFLGFRLAPDQFPLSRQVQIACDTPKLAVSRLTGKDAPSFPDDEKTIEDLKKRVAATLAYLDGCTAADFEGADTRVISTPRWEGKVMSGADYFVEHSVPNFFFHASHVYAILRHNGVEVGKKDFLGALTQRAQ